jgi:GR25 family glycosyltransferase involved in LPS biosynthesis
MCRYLFCNRSIIGCAMSHINLWKIISNSNDKWHLILEDDAEFNDKTVHLINSLYRSPLLNWDNMIINLYCSAGKSCKEALTTEQEPQMSKLLVESKYVVGMVAYLITRGAAKKLYDHLMKYKVNYHIDYQIADDVLPLGEIQYLSTENDIIKSSYGGYSISTIGSKSLFLLSNLLNSLGLIKFSWIMGIPLFTINLSIAVNYYVLFFCVLLIINFFWLHSTVIYIYLILEFTISLIMNN